VLDWMGSGIEFEDIFIMGGELIGFDVCGFDLLGVLIPKLDYY